jgi:hypothetical protein
MLLKDSDMFRDMPMFDKKLSFFLLYIGEYFNTKYKLLCYGYMPTATIVLNISLTMKC